EIFDFLALCIFEAVSSRRFLKSEGKPLRQRCKAYFTGKINSPGNSHSAKSSSSVLLKFDLIISIFGVSYSIFKRKFDTTLDADLKDFLVSWIRIVGIKFGQH
ncbi:hypothetical protein ACROYT_G021195, partial [Oculina patagonica]